MDQDHLGIRSDEALWNNSHGFIKRHESYLDTVSDPYDLVFIFCKVKDKLKNDVLVDVADDEIDG